MIIVLLGASGSGKSAIENELVTKHGYKKIIPYTTRKMRSNEIDGKDYLFVTYDAFELLLKDGHFMTCEKYSQGRYYGTSVSNYCGENNKVVILTPNGLRSLKQHKRYSDKNVCTVYINANLGTRIKRYIDRCGVDKFNYDDKNEITARVERDFGMFMGVDDIADLVVENNEGANISEVVGKILLCVKEKSKMQSQGA